MSSYVMFDGKYFGSDEPIFRADNRGYRYGDGVFETMTYYSGRIVLVSLHMQRLFSSMKLLNYKIPEDWTPEFFQQHAKSLCERNALKNARIRLSASRGYGNLKDTNTVPSYLLEATPLPATSYRFNQVGATINIHEACRKAAGQFSNIKSANYLPYVMASIFATEQELTDALVLNEHGRVCDSSVANIFIIKDGLLMTPSLKEGPVAGIIRRYIIEEAPAAGFEVVETAIDISMLHTADEIVLTNALHPITWVERFQNVSFSNHIARQLYQLLFEPLIG